MRKHGALPVPKFRSVGQHNDGDPAGYIDRYNRYAKVKAHMEKGGGDTPSPGHKVTESAPPKEKGPQVRATSMRVGGPMKQRANLEGALKETE